MLGALDNSFNTHFETESFWPPIAGVTQIHFLPDSIHFAFCLREKIWRTQWDGDFIGS